MHFDLMKGNKIAHAANKCLGEIGPVNLSTLVLTPALRHKHENEYFDSTNNHITIADPKVVQNLLNFVVNGNHSTGAAAAQALKHVLKTTKGAAVLDRLQKIYFGAFSLVYFYQSHSFF